MKNTPETNELLDDSRYVTANAEIAPTTEETENNFDKEYWINSCIDLLKIVGVSSAVLGSLVLPVLMLYVGVSYHYCDDLLSIWLIVGSVLMLIDIPVCGIHFSLNRVICSRYVYNKTAFIMFIIASSFVGIWWCFGFGRIFEENGDIYQEEFMKDEVCKFYLFTFSYWICLIPFIFIGLLFLVVIVVGGFFVIREPVIKPCCLWLQCKEDIFYD